MERSTWKLVALAFGAYVVLSVERHQPFHLTGSLGYFDLKVYRGAAHLLLGGQSVYDHPWPHFTYPPFAALVFAPLALAPVALDEILVPVLSVAALVGVAWFALRLSPGELERGSGRPAGILIGLGVGAALWLEPVTTTLGYGQINVVIALLVLADLGRRDSARTKGAMIGVAAGLKLTPLIFVAYLLLCRRVHAALVALSVFAVTIVLPFAVVPGDASRYWGTLVLDSKRVGGCCTPSNQSLRGAVLALDPLFSPAALVALSVIVALVGIAVAVRASRRGDEALGFSVCALTALLVSPVSWSHHWTLAVPALLIYAARSYRHRSRSGLAICAGLLVVGCSYLPEMATRRYPHGGAMPLVWMLASNAYVLVGLAALAVICAREALLPRAARTRLERPIDDGQPATVHTAHNWLRASAEGERARHIAPGAIGPSANR